MYQPADTRQRVYRRSKLSGSLVHALAALLGITALAPPAQALGTSELLDVVIQAVEPQLQPAKPLLLCLIGGKSLQACIDQEIQKQAATLQQEASTQATAALPFDPNDSRITQIVAVVKAASQGKWLEVLNKGGTTVGKIVACAALPPGVKSVGCPVTDYVIDNNKQLIDDAWDAVQGPDWWALATLLGPQTACQFIPVAEIKSTLCGPLGAAVEAAVTLAKGGVKLVSDTFGDASELLVNFTEDVAGQDPPMAPEKYYMDYWYRDTHWYVLAVLTGGGSAPPDMQLEYNACVGYFDGHKASKSTAQKWCGKMREQAKTQFSTALNAVKAAPAVYLKSTLEPQLPRLALEYFHESASSMMPGSLGTDCVYTLRDSVPIPGLLPQQNVMHGKWNSAPFTGWEWACKQVTTAFNQALQNYKNQATPALTTKMANAGCKTQQPTKGDTKLRFLCDSWEGLGTCKTEVTALGGKDDSGHCGLDSTKATTKLAAQIAAQLGTRRCAVPATNARAVQCTRPWKVAQCKALVEQAQGGSVADAYQVSCLAKDDPSFSAGQAEVKNLLFKLNGGVGSKTDAVGTKAGAGGSWASASENNCQAVWDPLAISCKSPDVLAIHNVTLPGCPADPDKDGADAPCLVSTMTYQLPKEADIKAGPMIEGPLKNEVSSSTPAMPVRDAAVRMPATAPSSLSTTPGAALPSQARMPPLTSGRSTGLAVVPGCTAIAGQAGEFVCTTSESLARCERQRIAGAAGIRACSEASSRVVPMSQPEAGPLRTAPAPTSAPSPAPSPARAPSPLSPPPATEATSSRAGTLVVPPPPPAAEPAPAPPPGRAVPGR